MEGNANNETSGGVGMDYPENGSVCYIAMPMNKYAPTAASLPASGWSTPVPSTLYLFGQPNQRNFDENRRRPKILKNYSQEKITLEQQLSDLQLNSGRRKDYRTPGKEYQARLTGEITSLYGKLKPLKSSIGLRKKLQMKLQDIVCTIFPGNFRLT